MPPRRWFFARLRPAVAALLLCVGVSARAQAQDPSPLKAAVLFNLLGFVQWPGESELPPRSPLHLCAERGSPMWPHLMALNERSLRQFQLAVREAPGSDTRAACHVWLIDRPGAARPSAGRIVAQGPMLLIGDAAGADEPGVVIALRMSGDRVAFDIDLAAARQGGVQISSKLLRLARSVRE